MKKKPLDILISETKKFGNTTLGLNSNYMWNNDPKKLFISMSRYKFVAKMFDVLEYIEKKHEKFFLKNICSSLKKNGSLIIGMPTLESQTYASKWSKEGHINCKTKNELKKFLSLYFNNIYMFSMNDEVVHTGYNAMSHYILHWLVTRSKISINYLN